ncbi:helix-turn-helix domain-containing protein [Burkholderia ubonensis]|uniref:helix-turn-helix domain-containing protein n=1 Tax=Burkholderia ubonensis TaxID=101571 RepID=UPI0039F5C7FF
MVVIFLSAGFSMAQAARLVEAFNLANRSQTICAAYQLRFVSANGGLLQSSSGVQVATDALDDDHGRRAYAFFHLHGDHALVAWNEDLLRRLRDLQANARWVADGMKLATIAASKWESACEDAASLATASLVSAAKDVEPSEQAADVLSAVMDMFRHDLGDGAVEEITRHISRPVDERFVQSMWAIRELSASPSIRTSMQQLRAQSVNRISIAGAAQAVAMSERNFLRRFKKEVGVTPTEFVLHVRLERACHMLVHTSLPADKVARRIGLGSGERMAKLFRQRLSMSPTEYRTSERARISKVGITLPYAPSMQRSCGLAP